MAAGRLRMPAEASEMDRSKEKEARLMMMDSMTVGSASRADNCNNNKHSMCVVSALVQWVPKLETFLGGVQGEALCPSASSLSFPVKFPARGELTTTTCHCGTSLV